MTKGATSPAGEKIPDDLFQDDSTKPESNWFGFDKIGDSIQGVLVMDPYEKQSKFGPQIIYVVQTADNKEFNVPLKKETQKVLIQQLKGAEVGDIIAFRYTEDIDTGKINPAKRIEVRIRKLSKII